MVLIGIIQKGFPYIMLIFGEILVVLRWTAKNAVNAGWNSASFREQILTWASQIGHSLLMPV